MLTALEHFTEEVTDEGEHIITLLQNLRCLTLTHFGWYKDTFLNRVMQLDDANNPHWKSKFIDIRIIILSFILFKYFL